MSDMTIHWRKDDHPIAPTPNTIWTCTGTRPDILVAAAYGAVIDPAGRALLVTQARGVPTLLAAEGAEADLVRADLADQYRTLTGYEVTGSQEIGWLQVVPHQVRTRGPELFRTPTAIPVYALTAHRTGDHQPGVTLRWVTPASRDPQLRDRIWWQLLSRHLEGLAPAVVAA